MLGQLTERDVIVPGSLFFRAYHCPDYTPMATPSCSGDQGKKYLFQVATVQPKLKILVQRKRLSIEEQLAVY